MFVLIDVKDLPNDFIKRNYDALETIENYLLMANIQGHKVSTSVLSSSNYSGKYYDITVYVRTDDNDKTKNFTLRIFENKKAITKAMFFIRIYKNAVFDARKMSHMFKKAGISTWNKEKSKFGTHSYELYFYNDSNQVRDALVLFGPYIA
ncbi:hypothetical protein D3C87_76540 [compost metagenome]